ncbi:ATP-dependent sacrificial sulfur transferase LarE [Synechococcus lacustris]|uniref:ATP-dependent sacrificial sulfur transferase LarE n=1 Tax=Synechococcus lacustris TaxID=2116544 RepID=UPI0020CEFFA6|nr:ATP-dependent sacrificial sulfur transferase LarE [Synechococcus lacustris]
MVIPISAHPLVESLAAPRQAQLLALRTWLGQQPAVLVAYSGGVDSTLVAALAAEQLGEKAEAVTGVSPALAPNLLEEARWQASWLGLRHREIESQELQEPGYSSNPENRCYYCKRELHSLLAQLAGGALVLDGVNQDDQGDYRPGLQAAAEKGVASPLLQFGIDKQGVRQISRALGFPWWDKPAQPCLASRFPYGEPVSASRLQRVAKGEDLLRQFGFSQLRLRCQGDTARLELQTDQFELLLKHKQRQELVEQFLALGFTAVSVDLEGLVSGKLNRSLIK